MKKNILFLLIASTLLFVLISCEKKETNKDNYIDSLLSEMTLEEKIGMIHGNSSFYSNGVERLGIPEMAMSDGPHGVRMEHGRDWEVDDITTDSATYLPTGITLASTWNKELGYEYGKVLGSEANERGKDMILGPGINIIRSPLNGRNFEYLSEDPYLTSQMCIGYIKGVQEQGVAACAKHYAANNQETNRGHINAQVSERALREIYLPAFKAAVQDAGVLSIMSAYNKVNGTFCSNNKFLLDDVLRGEFGFEGLVVSDWGAVHDTKETLLHGVDIEMGTDLDMLPLPDYNDFYLADAAIEMVKKGEVPEAAVDEKVKNILHVMQKTNKLGERPQGARNTKEHQAVALKVAEEGIVLLKNEDALPIRENIKTIAVIGNNAVDKHAHKGGSSQVKPLYEVTPLEGIKNLVGDKVEILFAKGYQPSKENDADNDLISEAIDVAEKADLVIYVGGWIHSLDSAAWAEDCFDAEAKDKESFELLFGQEKLINEVIKVNSNMVSVIFGGSSVKFGDWSDNSKAILHVWYPGMEGGNAIANILFGNTNPSGKLPISMAKDYTDYSDHVLGEFPGDSINVVYNDDIFVGYRFFETYGKVVEYPFGHGLSYTIFNYGKIKVAKKKFSAEENVKIKLDVTNSGKFDGAEVIQLYVSDLKSSVPRPVKELKAFEKIFLKQGETKTVEFELDDFSFSYFDPKKGDWVVEPGKFEILIGSSSTDIKQTAVIAIK